MKKLIIAIALTGIAVATYAQDNYFTRNGKATFFSSTPIEDIKAINEGVVTVLNVTNGNIEVSMLNKSFQFKKALMQEHFNENYMESNTYPKSAFKGTVSMEDVELEKPGKYDVTVAGDLTIHGETKKIEVPGTIEIKGENLIANTVFKVVPEEYGIKIPGTVRNNIAEEIEVTIDLTLQPLVQ